MDYIRNVPFRRRCGERKEAGKDIVSNVWTTLYHELGGHGYLQHVSTDAMKKIEECRCRGIIVDYENKVRNLNGLAERAYDDFHSSPKKNNEDE